MSDTDSPIPSDEWLDLLVRELTDELTPAERSTLAGAGSPELVARYRRELEQTAGAIALGLAETGPQQPLPPALQGRLEEQAAAFLVPSARAADVISLPASRQARSPSSAPASSRPATSSGTAGWWAAAACLLLALIAWFRTPQTVFMPAPPSEVKQLEPTPEMRRATLLTHPGVITLPLGATKDPAAAGLSGDVVWDPVAQQGFIRVVGLQPNDPKIQQYQLWIFDGDRDQRYPVDGGVFNSSASGGEVLIPIHAAIPVHLAKAFAVTVEKPGGVVVSARDRVVALAQAS
jgi:hypothetical protein